MADPTKAETEQVFKVLKAQKGNKLATRHGQASPSECTSVSTAPAYTEIWECTLAS
ncbi:hypothetical protein AcW2_007751 [Taiwanofungus camphoratus]|nr:hypothetical protein AcW2_007751 [Antrodia cinnamomea]